MEATGKSNDSFSACVKFQIDLLPAVFGVEFIVALAGNLLALWLLMVRERKNWHSGVILSCNLVVSDLLYILTLPMLIVYYALKKHWVFGEVACQIEKFLFACNLYASIFFIMIISVNRCVAITWPFFTRTYVRPAHTKAASVVIWVIVVVISCPVLKFASVCPHKYGNNTECVSFCYRAGDESPHYTYVMFLAIFGCLLPFLVTLASYVVVIRVVWKNANITPQEKRKVALLVSCVLVLYAVSFVPYHLFRTYNLYLKLNREQSVCWVYHMYQISKGLATLNMCIHPLLYMAVFDSIRVACCGRNHKNNEVVTFRK